MSVSQLSRTEEVAVVPCIACMVSEELISVFLCPVDGRPMAYGFTLARLRLSNVMFGNPDDGLALQSQCAGGGFTAVVVGWSRRNASREQQWLLRTYHMVRSMAANELSVPNWVFSAAVSRLERDGYLLLDDCGSLSCRGDGWVARCDGAIDVWDVVCGRDDAGHR